MANDRISILQGGGGMRLLRTQRDSVRVTDFRRHSFPPKMAAMPDSRVE